MSNRRSQQDAGLRILDRSTADSAHAAPQSDGLPPLSQSAPVRPRVEEPDKSTPSPPETARYTKRRLRRGPLLLWSLNWFGNNQEGKKTKQDLAAECIAFTNAQLPPNEWLDANNNEDVKKVLNLIHKHATGDGKKWIESRPNPSCAMNPFEISGRPSLEGMLAPWGVWAPGDLLEDHRGMITPEEIGLASAVQETCLSTDDAVDTASAEQVSMDVETTVVGDAAPILGPDSHYDAFTNTYMSQGAYHVYQGDLTSLPSQVCRDYQDLNTDTLSDFDFGLSDSDYGDLMPQEPLQDPYQDTAPWGNDVIAPELLDWNSLRGQHFS